MVPIPGLIAFYFIMPALILWLCYKSTLIDKIGSVILAYVFGILLGNSGLLPEGAVGVQDELS